MKVNLPNIFSALGEWRRQLRSSSKIPLLIWLISLAVFISILFIGSRSTIGEPAPMWLLIGLYGINSVIFLALWRQFPKLGVTMLIFIFMFELSVIGYYFFTAASLAS